jgi:hypothetical protein
VSKNQKSVPTTIRSSAAEYLAFVAASELKENSVIRNFRITASDGTNYNTTHYSLSVVKDYFRELLGRIRSIRIGESLSRNFWVTNPKLA